MTQLELRGRLLRLHARAAVEQWNWEHEAQHVPWETVEDILSMWLGGSCGAVAPRCGAVAPRGAWLIEEPPHRSQDHDADRLLEQARRVPHPLLAEVFRHEGACAERFLALLTRIGGC